jgi:hypothetical protein
MGAIFFMCTDTDFALRVETLNDRAVQHVQFNRLKVKVMLPVDPMKA